MNTTSKRGGHNKPSLQDDLELVLWVEECTNRMRKECLQRGEMKYALRQIQELIDRRLSRSHGTPNARAFKRIQATNCVKSFARIVRKARARCAGQYGIAAVEHEAEPLLQLDPEKAAALAAAWSTAQNTHAAAWAAEWADLRSIELRYLRRRRIDLRRRRPSAHRPLIRPRPSR